MSEQFIPGTIGPWLDEQQRQKEEKRNSVHEKAVAQRIDEHNRQRQEKKKEWWRKWGTQQETNAVAIRKKPGDLERVNIPSVIPNQASTNKEIAIEIADFAIGNMDIIETLSNNEEIKVS